MQAFRKRFTGRGTPIPGIPEWESELLLARGIDTAEKAQRFLHPSDADLHDPLAMQDMEKAVHLIRAAIQRGEHITVYGDYDVDGVSAVTVLLETLLEEGADADFRIPERHSEGYGLNERAVREIAEKSSLLITVDCGISNVKEVRIAKELGMTVIVTDHHALPDTLPEADAVLNPLLGTYPFRRLCGAGVALKICQAMQGMAGVEKRIEVAALATVCDVVQLSDENRYIVWEGLRRMGGTRRSGLRALMEKAGVSAPVRAEDLAFRLGPRINAAGRLEGAAQGVRLLMTRDPAEAEAIAAHLEENNRLRQDTERQLIREAMAGFDGQVDLKRDRAVILEGENWNSGVIGLAAGKLCEKFHHPTVVLSRQGDTAVGSCRSIPGVNIWEMLSRCGGLLVRFGGHEQAAGLTIRTEDIPAFREKLNAVIRESCDDRCFLPVKEYDAELPLEAVTLQTVDALDALEPTGCGNPPPVFLVRGAELQESRRVGKDGSHLKLALLEGGALRGGIAFGLGDLADQDLRRVDVLYCPSRNEYNGRVSAQIMVQAMEPAGRDETPREKTRERIAGTSGGDNGEYTAETVGDNTGKKPGEMSGEALFLMGLQEMGRLAAKKTDVPKATNGLRPEHLLKERLEKADPSREAMGAVYRAARTFRGDSAAELAASLDVPEEQAIFALEVFRELGFLTYTLEPLRITQLPSGRRDLAESGLIRYVTGIRKTRDGD